MARGTPVRECERGVIATTTLVRMGESECEVTCLMCNPVSLNRISLMCRRVSVTGWTRSYRVKLGHLEGGGALVGCSVF